MGTQSYPWCTQLTNGKLCANFVDFSSPTWSAKVLVGYTKTNTTSIYRRFAHSHNGANHYGPWGWQGKGTTSYTWQQWPYGCDTVIGFMQVEGSPDYRIPPDEPVLM